MTQTGLQGSVRALLSEYRKAIDALIQVITPLQSEVLCAKADIHTKDPDCVSIQTVLTHVVSSGYGYTVYMEKHMGMSTERPERKAFTEVAPYIEQLNNVYEYCENFFKHHPDIVIEENDPAKKIWTNWGQQYDIDQLMEHAIVHILRHRRQIEGFIATLNKG